jgi:hypothetical protein
MPVGTLSAARTGIQRAAAELETSSRNVARFLPQALRAAEQSEPDTAEGVQTGSEPAPVGSEAAPVPSLEREIVRQSLALVQGQASIRTAEVELELLGTLVDLMA